MSDPQTAMIVFWVGLAILVHTWIGYPVCLFLLERLLYRPVRRGAYEPTVTVLVSCYNEEEAIGRKIENLLQLDYPADKLHIVVASDGSYDGTATVVRAYASQGVELQEFHTRRGKPAMLNDIIPELESEVVLLADARQRFEPDLLRRMVPLFADAEVGAVSGELVFEAEEKAGISVGMDVYWRYEKWIRTKESNIDSSIGATGAVLAIRRDCFQPIPGETVLDDVVLPLHLMRQNRRVVLVPGALAWDHIQTDWQREFTRKTRTLSGNFQILSNFLRMGLGVRMLGFSGFAYISHKVLRLLGPVCLALVFLSTVTLVNAPETAGLSLAGYSLAYVLQFAFYVLALGGALLRRPGVRLPLLSTAYGFVIMQAAVVVGFLRFISGRDDVLWEKAHLLDPATTWNRLWRLLWDSSLFTLGFVFAFYVRYWGAPPVEALQSYMQLFPHVDVFGIRFAVPIVMLLPMAIFYIFRVNEPRTNDLTPEHFLLLLKGLFYSTLALFLVIYLRRSMLLMPMSTGETITVVSIPTGVLLIGFVLNALLIGGWRMALLWYRWTVEDETEEQREILLLGDVHNASLVSATEGSYEPRARVFASLPAGKCVSSYLQELRHLLERSHPSEMLLVGSSLPRQALIETVGEADERKLRAGLLPGDLELLLGNARPRLTCLIPVVEPGGLQLTEVFVSAKRGIDLLLGLSAMLVGAPWLLALLLASRTGNARPVRIGWVRRLGRKAETIWLPRLRHAGAWPCGWRRLARLTLTGFALASGRLTLVGYRPPRWGEPEHLRPWVRRVLGMAPGLLYLPRVLRAEAGRLDSRAAAVIYYMRNAGPALDVRILLGWARFYWQHRRHRKAAEER